MATEEERAKVEAFIKDAASSPAKTERAAQRYAEARGRRDTELQLWHKWNDSGRKPEHLEPLLKSIDPLIKSETKKRLSGLGGSISQHAMTMELRRAATRAIEKYDPTKGKLSTHLVGNFKRVTDFVAANRNARYMPKEDVGKYQLFQNAVNEFKEEHGREPTVGELQQALPKWSLKQIRKMQRGFGSEAFTDMGVDLEHDVDVEDPMAKIRGAMMLMQSKLTPEQIEFGKMHYPGEGEQQMSVSQIAKAMKIPEHRAYRIKKRVEAILSPVVRGT